MVSGIGAAGRSRLLGEHERVQVAHLGQPGLDVLHVHLHRVLELGRVLRPQSGLNLGQGVLQGLQLERVPARKEQYSIHVMSETRNTRFPIAPRLPFPVSELLDVEHERRER